MKKYILILIAVLLSIASFAHNPNVSTTMLVEKENTVWVLQISVALTAFQQEINTHFYETPYNSPEEFREMVLQHLKNNLQLRFNGNDAVQLGKGIVVLGHETKVVFQVVGVPADLHALSITNTAFEDIYRSQSALVILKENFTKNKFVLNSNNGYTKFLEVQGNELIEAKEQKASLFFLEHIIILMGVMGLAFLVYKIFKTTKPGHLSV